MAGLIISVHCRSGSLETPVCRVQTGDIVHCRSGSLENQLPPGEPLPVVHCRSGSLETIAQYL